MKKLKPWQIALLIIFYPAGIVYLILYIINYFNKNKPLQNYSYLNSLQTENKYLRNELDKTKKELIQVRAQIDESSLNQEISTSSSKSSTNNLTIKDVANIISNEAKKRHNKIQQQEFSSDIHNHYMKILEQDRKDNINYNKQSKIVSIFSRKWYKKCAEEFVVLDFETTGLDKVYDKIIEVAAIRYVNGIETEKYITLVNPQIPIPTDATEINNITNKMVSSSPTEVTVIPKLIDFIGDTIIVGHNVNFDIGFLEIAAQRLNINVSYNYIDTLSISKKLFPGLSNYKLSTIADTLSLDTSNLHRAESDVRICAEITQIALDTLSTDFEI